MSQQRRSRSRLTAADWAEAALTAMREGGGLKAVAIEPLAVRLGATKGSFYWHFANREALIEAALNRWEQRHTEEVIAALRSERDPLTRVRELFYKVTGDVVRDPTELALLASADHPRVAAAIRRVTTRRLDYLVGLFRDLGLSGTDARHRALQAYSCYLGRACLAHSVPGVLPRGEEDRRYLDSVLDSLLGLRARGGTGADAGTDVGADSGEGPAPGRDP
ncbi:TetR/AcrR family transcriptional regulator [Streptomyces sp. URMC 129]|uniref:TetR/AcrR family transcriptional regulator n=1 Tax=Streptomyces sp. URMC 129 TaxID=3423407 RepID=UPI003F1B3E5B